MSLYSCPSFVVSSDRGLQNSGKREDAGFRIGKGPPGAGADLPKQVSFLNLDKRCILAPSTQSQCTSPHLISIAKTYNN